MYLNYVKKVNSQQQMYIQYRHEKYLYLVNTVFKILYRIIIE